MDLGLRGKVALIGGGSKGMPRSAADFLAEAGCIVAIVSRNSAATGLAVDEVIRAGGRAIGVVQDLADQRGVEEAVAEVTRRLGVPDIVVSSTSDETFGSFESADPTDFELVFSRLVMPRVYMTKATIPGMREKKWGRYIHIGSIVGKEANFTHPHIFHNTVRPAAVAYLRVVAQETAADGVTVNVVGPGLVRTEHYQGTIRDRYKFSAEEESLLLAGELGATNAGSRGAAQIPMKRAGEPAEVGAFVAFLASVYGGYTTGNFFMVAGGRHYSTF